MRFTRLHSKKSLLLSHGNDHKLHYWCGGNGRKAGWYEICKYGKRGTAKNSEKIEGHFTFGWACHWCISKHQENNGWAYLPEQVMYKGRYIITKCSCLTFQAKWWVMEFQQVIPIIGVGLFLSWGVFMLLSFEVSLLIWNPDKWLVHFRLIFTGKLLLWLAKWFYIYTPLHVTCNK